MKIVNYILSIIIVILSSMPCADMEVGNSACSRVEFASKQDNHSHSNKNDLCPPFCVCNCCGAQILNFSPGINVTFPQLTSIIHIPLPSYISEFTSNFYGSIWQPPQIIA
ncbi:DUF6660 family protein [Flavobacterium sp. 102]|uniref:DUF6660 family protein n=1 Tax=Flavobacterium sp. 102 TaxID=2135623 RepID=UPI001F2024AF|nr:DUF6660 family protein [Flavobacterium sp. 102]